MDSPCAGVVNPADLAALMAGMTVLTSHITALQSFISNRICSSLDTLTDVLALLGRRVNMLEARNSLASPFPPIPQGPQQPLVSKVQELAEASGVQNSTPPGVHVAPSSALEARIVRDRSEMDRRAKSFVILGLPEASSSPDRQRVEAVLSALQIPGTPRHVKRLGRSSGLSPRTVRVTLETPTASTVAEQFRHARELSLDLPPGLCVKADRTQFFRTSLYRMYRIVPLLKELYHSQVSAKIQCGRPILDGLEVDPREFMKSSFFAPGGFEIRTDCLLERAANQKVS